MADTPQEIPFLNILQHLLSIEPKDPISDIVWDTAETLVHRATLLENREDSTKLLRAPSVQKLSCPHCRVDLISPNRKLSLPHNLTSSVTLTTPQSQNGVIPPPPPLLPGNVPAAPPPPPPCGKNLIYSNQSNSSFIHFFEYSSNPSTSSNVKQSYSQPASMSTRAKSPQRIP